MTVFRRSGKLSWDVTTTEVNSALHPSGVAKSSTSFIWGKGGKVTAVGWQVTLCDPIWHVISRNGVVISITNCYIRVYFTFTLPVHCLLSDCWRSCVYREFARTMSRPFELVYNAYTQRVIVIDKPDSISSAVDDIRNQLSIVSSALRKLQVT